MTDWKKRILCIVLACVLLIIASMLDKIDGHLLEQYIFIFVIATWLNDSYE